MEKKLTGLCIMIISIALVLAACSGGGETPADDETEGNDDTVYELSFTYFASEAISTGINYQAACDKAEELSNGRIQFTTYFNGTYVTWEDTIASTGNGVVDIGMVDTGMLSEMFELNEIFGRPSEAIVPSRSDVASVYTQLVSEFPELDEELSEANVKWLSIHALGGYHFCSAGNTNIIHPDDVAGLVIDSMGDSTSYIVSLGASAVSMDPSDYYISLERGVVNVNCNSIGAFNAFSLQEIAKTITVFGSSNSSEGGGLWAPAIGIVINLDTYNELPQDLIDILVEVFDEAQEKIAEADYVDEQKFIEEAEANGATINYVDDAVRAEWGEAMVTPNENWIAKLEGEGFDIQTLFDRMIELFGQYEPKY